MLKLIIEDDEGRKTVVPFVRDEITIGRQEGNTIRLTERNVSRRHARLLRNNGSVQVEDLGSYNGIRLNGEKVSGRVSVNDGDLIQIGDYDLAIQHEGTDQPVNAPTPPMEATQPGTPPPLSRPTVQVPILGPTEEVHTEASSAVFEEAEPLPEAEAEEDSGQEEAQTPTVQEAPRRQSTAIIRAEQVEASRSRPVLELDAEEAPRLVVLNTEFAGREFACIRTELRIGRDDENDISLDHRSLSRTHAKLVRESTGEWRIIDMQSANGLRVNGETYAQSTVAHLDVIELGHLKLKFVGSGETFTFVPGTDSPGGARRKGRFRAPVFVTAGILLVGGGAAGAWFYGPQLGLPALMNGGAATVEQTPVDTPRPLTPPEPSRLTAPRPEPVEAPPAENAATIEARQKLSIARGAIAQAQLTRAVEVLDSVKKLGEVQQAVLDDTQHLLDKARGELIMKERLDQAAVALKRARLEQARKLLDQSSATEVFADRHEALSRELTTRIDAAASRRKVQSQVAVARGNGRVEKVVRTPPPPDEPPPDEVVQEQNSASKLFEDGKRLLEKRQTREARSVLLQCVELNPRYSRCHLLLGAAYAKLGDAASGAKHYELFLKLDPDAQEAGTVRMMLEQYRESRKGNN